MARIARVVVPEFPHHIIQRGNRRQKVFFKEDDYREYLRFLNSYSEKFKVDILAYCLMPNHIHLIAIPHEDGSLAQAIGETHRNYTRFINFREKWRGYLWQGRFSSYVLDEQYLLAATRYILLNPVKAKMVNKPWDYKWSSARQHMMLDNSFPVKDSLLRGLVGSWEKFLTTAFGDDDSRLLQLHERTGRPLGGAPFIEKLEDLLKINLKKKRAGRKMKEK
ncbi:MAG: transposase [Omnitrophica WOR_2 bacterium GWF2_43_52]|nr:MAG: transposase [Omnitrophica WOR_2 bacterium GWA2_44_7]OGX22660.1 MAG: transposase [Omnitrophica WOR_2 bacterium GWF2_43_52]OGX55517.1 MAG: transposase [Omnitrophica WOR_2 bacterium RIFOXYC2_FULL_43_9]HAH19725.1 transposase [Candidatus Omnitrophota bacterium]HBG64759.1 transposase [Candidatus Omnitrophota bacterium]